MKLRNTMVITPKKGQEILGKIVFVELRQRTYDAEVKRNVTPQGFRPVGHENVSGMHVGMKKAVAKDLRKENQTEEHTSELQSLMRTSYDVFCLKQKINSKTTIYLQANNI